MVLWPEPQQAASVSITALQLGVYLDQCDVTLFDQKGSVVCKDFTPIGRMTEFKTPDATPGVVGVVASAGWNAFAVEKSNSPLMIVPDDFLTVNAQRGLAGRFYFYVPENCPSFKITLQGDPGEYVDYTLFDAANQPAFEVRQLKATATQEIPVTKAGIWCVEVDNAIDDAGFKLEGIPNVFALRPEHIRIPQTANPN